MHHSYGIHGENLMTMRELTYQVSFNTPAFLGNAEQQAQWRTPPFKALLRQWWRVVKAPQLKPPFNVDELRTAENALFGAASDDGADKSHRSLVRLRLTKDSGGGVGWENGAMKQWLAGGPSQFHPEVGEHGHQVGAELYLGYGPLGFKAGQTAFNTIPNSDRQRTAIDTKTGACLRLIFPAEHHVDLSAAMQLAALFGTLGSRSRNGWGALQLQATGNGALAPTLLTRSGIANLAVTRPLSSCLQQDWPHAIGHDRVGPLVWRTRITGDARQVMLELARIKIAFRTQPALSLDGVPAGTFSNRHFLAYPVTHHPVTGLEWGGQGRLANQVRFKVLREGNQLVGVIVHLPCRLPAAMAAGLPHQVRNNIDALQLQAWQDVHAMLDQLATRLA
jgi:CRISPR-associated protein Cmr1